MSKMISFNYNRGNVKQRYGCAPPYPHAPPGRNNAPTPNSLAAIINLKPQSNSNDNDDNNGKDTMIASASKNNDDCNVVFFAQVTVVVQAADDGGTCPHGHLLTSMLSRVSCHLAGRRRGSN